MSSSPIVASRAVYIVSLQAESVARTASSASNNPSSFGVDAISIWLKSKPLSGRAAKSEIAATATCSRAPDGQSSANRCAPLAEWMSTTLGFCADKVAIRWIGEAVLPGAYRKAAQTQSQTRDP